MKCVAKIFLFLFLAFLSTPTIISLIKKSTDISTYFNFNEEEIHKDYKDVKAHLNQNFEFVEINFSIEFSSFIFSENSIKHDNLAEEIIVEPPEFI